MPWYEEGSTPRYARPPVVETAIAVQFPPVVGLTMIPLVRLQDAWRARFPRLSEHPGTLPEPTTIAPEAGPILQFGPAPVRIWAEQDETGLLVQTQADRLVLNWRAPSSTGPYPHYEKLRDEFERLWSEFLTRLDGEGLPLPEPQRVDFTYVNDISLHDHEAFEDVITFIEPSETRLPGTPSMTRFQVLRAIERDAENPFTAQIWISGEPQFGPNGRSLQLNITTAILGVSPGELWHALDVAHALGGHTFAAATTTIKQQEWDRQ